MKPDARHRWIMAYMKAFTYDVSVDILNSDFVYDYIEATGARVAHQPYGAPKCPQLARDLLQMKKDFRLTRKRVGVEGMGGMGFPTWVWSYQLRPPPEWLAELDAKEGLPK